MEIREMNVLPTYFRPRGIFLKYADKYVVKHNFFSVYTLQPISIVHVQVIWAKQGFLGLTPHLQVWTISPSLQFFPPGWHRLADSSAAPAGLWLVGLLKIPTHLHPLLMEGLRVQSIKKN